MAPQKVKTFYNRNLPHIQPIGACFFVTFRLYESIPKVKLFELKEQFEIIKSKLVADNSLAAKEELYNQRKIHFSKYDNLLHKIESGPHYLKDNMVANIVKQQLHRFDGDLYDLVAYTIMSNHVHILIDTSLQLPDGIDVYNFEELTYKPLSKILQRIKGASARYANIELDRTGETFWQEESYDHYVRNEKEFNRIIAYILNNPVKVGLVKEWQEYPHSFVKMVDENVRSGA